MPAWPRSRTQVLDGSGRPYLDLKANFFAGGTTTPLVVFSDPGKTQAHPQPVVADANGRFPRVYLPDGLYAEQVLGTNSAELWYDDGLGVAVPVVDPVDPTPAPDPTAVFQTGDTKWRPDVAILPGWVRMNGNTIGHTNSGASERANTDTLALFTYLYNNFDDGIAAVAGGRTASGAAADFALGRSITVPSMRGLLAGGLDDMGATAAGRLQTVRTLTLNAGSSAATVSDSTRLTPGMYVFASGVSAGTFITGINGNALTLSAPAAGGGSVNARFSFVNAQQPGAAGGDFLTSVSTGVLPVTMPGGTAVYDDPADVDKAYAVLQTIDYGDGGSTTKVSGLWQNVTDTVTDLPPVNLAVSINNPGGGLPLNVMPPMRLGTFYMKL